METTHSDRNHLASDLSGTKAGDSLIFNKKLDFGRSRGLIGAGIQRGRESGGFLRQVGEYG